MIYLNLSMLFILYDLYWDREQNQRRRTLYSIALFFQLVAIFLLSARTSLAVALLTFFIYSLVMVKKGRLGRKDAFPVILFFGLAILFQFGLLTFYNRYDQLTKLMNDTGSKEENSTSIRYNLWKTAAEVIREHPVAGVGIGDIKEELVKKYVANGYEYGIKNRISPHNQYLHTAVILGAIGFVLLVVMLLSSFVLAWRNGDWNYLLFIIIISLNALTESILERQAGILFFAFFNSFFASRYLGVTKTAAIKE
jgi:O-antigen ligase